MSLLAIPSGTSSNASGFYPYEIDGSLRFNDDDSAHLSRTPSTTSNRKTWTFSAWIKRGNLGTSQNIISSRAGTPACSIKFESGTDNCSLTVFGRESASTDYNLITNALYRDCSAWYHIVVVSDTPQATASNRMKVYVNGEQVTSFATEDYPSQNFDSSYNTSGREMALGEQPSIGEYFDGYMADVYWIDGTALDADDFGETLSGVWVPKAYSGSYGTNGFHLEFAGNANDSSGNGNNFTANNITSDDYVSDSPTLNFCTFNTLAKTSNVTLSNGNLDAAFGTVSGGGGVIATMAPSSGKWYWEVTVTAVSSAAVHIGIIKDVLSTFSGTQYYDPGLTSDSYAYQNNGTKYNNNSNTSYGASYTTNDVIGVAMDLDAGTLTFYKNNSSQGTAFTGLSGGYFPAVGDGSSAGTHSVSANFGQQDFTYTPPTDYLALCTANLPDPEIDPAEDNSPQDYFTSHIYSGDDSNGRAISIGFNPDLVWTKRRDGVANHHLMDAVRGTLKTLHSDTSDAEDTGFEGVSSFTSPSDGYSLNTDTSETSLNDTGKTYVSWNWKANGSGVSNTDGSITSTVSASTESGFSIISYTGNGTNNATIGHGLSTTPDFIMTKERDNAEAWGVFHSSIDNANFHLRLNETSALISATTVYKSANSSTYTVGTSGLVNSATSFIAYCFHSVEGFSKFGSYTGNGSSDGPFVYTGFRPAWVVVKRTDSSSNWTLLDTARSPYNVCKESLYPNLNFAEENSVTWMDIVSNGFKIRESGTGPNASGGTYIYMAFAENPFKYANAR